MTGLLSGLFGLRFGMAVWVLYYLLFTDYAGIGLVEAITLLTAFLAEVPTGILADRLGRKRTLLFSFAVLTAGYLVLASVQGLASLAGALVVLTVGRALYSGTLEALLYDTLQAAGQEIRYPAALARVHASHLVAAAGATLVGGFLYARDPRLPYLAAAGAQAAGFVVACFLVEPPMATARQAPLASARGPATPSPLSGLRPLLQTDRRLLALLVLVGAFAVVVDEIVDDVLAVEHGYGPTELGLLFAIVYLVAALATGLGPALLRRYEAYRSTLLVGLLLGGSLALTPLLGKLGGGCAIGLRYAARAVQEAISSSALNRSVPSAMRATTLSLFRLLLSLPYIAGAYGVGHLMDRIGGIRFAGWLGVALLLLLVPFLTRRR